MDSKNDRLAVDVREAAYRLSVSPRTIQNYIHAKLLPSRKFGRRTLIPVRALENFLRTDQPSPGTEVARADSDR
jgi:excisionase family DNA binding protein